MKMTAQEYARRVKKVGPHSPLGTDCLKSEAKRS